MKLFKITVKDYDYDCYDGFVIVAENIPQALEHMYEYVCADIYQGKAYFKDIPYYLRSSNLEIVCLGNFEQTIKLDSNIIMTSFNNA
jgi:hypothetical protein